MKYIIFAVYTQNILDKVSQKCVTIVFLRKGNWLVWEPRLKIGLFFKLPLYLLNIKLSEFIYQRRVLFCFIKIYPQVFILSSESWMLSRLEKKNPKHSECMGQVLRTRLLLPLGPSRMEKWACEAHFGEKPQDSIAFCLCRVLIFLFKFLVSCLCC